MSPTRGRLRRVLLRPFRARLDEVVQQRVRQEVRRRERDPSFRYVLVVAPGRSGSTLVQGLLNAIPGVVIRGENNLYLHGYFRLMQEFLEFRTRHGRGRPRQPVSAFYGVHEIKRRHFVDTARSLFLKGALGALPRDQVRVLGFKEVLWGRVSEEEREAFFSFLDDVLPDVRYVLNWRDPEVLVGSGFWTSMSRDEALSVVSRVRETQAFLRETRPGRTFDLRYETLTGDDQDARHHQLRGLAEFVTGESADEETLSAMVGAMQDEYGPHAFGRSRRDGHGATKPDPTPQQGQQG